MNIARIAIVYSVLILYVSLVIAGARLSVRMRDGWLRFTVRIATVLLALPLTLIAALLGLFWLFDPPSLATLEKKFPARRADLITLAQMARTEKTELRVISAARNWEGAAGILPDRMTEYRKLFARSGIASGVRRYDSGDVFIVVDGSGFLDHSRTTGYVFCVADPVPHETRRPEPCASLADSGSRMADSSRNQVAYSFRKLEEGWYVYDEGPWT